MNASELKEGQFGDEIREMRRGEYAKQRAVAVLKELQNNPHIILTREKQFKKWDGDRWVVISPDKLYDIFNQQNPE